MTISEALKELYVAIGGDIDDVGNCNSSTEILNKFSVFLGGTGSATQDADAIMNIVANAGSLNPTLIDKNITANGTYDPEDDEADGYKKVVVDVADENNTNLVRKTTNVSFTLDVTDLETLTIPEGYVDIDERTGTQYIPSAVNLKKIYLPSTMGSALGSTCFSRNTALEKITINKPEGSITGAPWGAPASCQIVWLG